MLATAVAAYLPWIWHELPDGTGVALGHRALPHDVVDAAAALAEVEERGIERMRARNAGDREHQHQHWE